jgi:D-glycero-D-manno-heptose 1,7-bisphosphate phosphatase
VLVAAADDVAGGAALFLDRDGVVNVDHGYVSRPEDCTFVDGIFDVGRAARHAGLALVVVTNQAGIGRGLYSEGDFRLFMEWVARAFTDEGCALSAVYYCPHHPVDGIGVYRAACPCRKPAPGMLLRAATDMKLDVGRSMLVGDRATDIDAGMAAGVSRLYLLSPDEPAGPATRLARLADLALELGMRDQDARERQPKGDDVLVRRACP